MEYFENIQNNFFNLINYGLLSLVIFVIYFVILRSRKKSQNTNLKNNTKMNNPQNQIIPYTMIEEKIHLQEIINKIHSDKYIDKIGLDTEYHRSDEYNGKLCTIQLAVPFQTSLQIFIIDILKFEKDFLKENLILILSNERIEKIIHSCENDIEWIYDELGILVKNIFDTQDAHEILTKGKKKTGLNVLLNTYFGLNLDPETKKSFQKSNWKQRPLSKEQLDYAAMDAFYLIELRNILHQKLSKDDKKLDFINLLKKNEFLSRIENTTKIQRKENKAINYLISNLTKCEEQTLEIIKNLFISLYRINEETAFKNNINSEKLFGLKIIYKVSMRLPKTKEDLIKIIGHEYIYHRDNQAHLCLFEELVTKIHNRICDHLHDSEKFIPIESLPQNEKNQSHIDLIARKQINREKIIQKFSCKKPVYENCHMYAPDGELLCYCDHKKMNWYLSRNLADIICDDPPKFKLKFEPNSRGCSDIGDIPSDFYVKYRKNCCVVCGFDENYMRFHVVPILYRTHFPEELKSHKSHDVVLLCFACHERANQIYDIQKRNVSEKFNVPLNTLSPDQQEIKQLENIIKNSKTMWRNFGLLPEDKKLVFGNELIDFLKENRDNEKFLHFYNFVFQPQIEKNSSNTNFEIPNKIEDLSQELLCRIKNYKIKIPLSCDKKNQHGKIVVSQLDDYTEFIKEWRIFFIEALQPKYLPDAWNVEHQFYRTFGEHSKFSKNKQK
jgi:cobalt/nickel-transporting P-type ATPase D